jgi:hypothetical protein
MLSSVVFAASYFARNREKKGCRGERPEASGRKATPPRNCSIIPDKRFSIRAVPIAVPGSPVVVVLD